MVVSSQSVLLTIECFFFNDTATTEIYTYGHTLSLHDALPIFARGRPTDLVFQTERAAHPGHPALVHRVASHRVLPFAGDQLAVLVLVRSAIGNLDEPVRMPLLHFTGEPGFLAGRHDHCAPRRRALRRAMRGVRRRVLHRFLRSEEPPSELQ